ncbi:MAG: hypothetical protein GXP14_02940 [Gammaproteobacteria bacterium]|nr:hypothetical protein [Gammaproteobacteria bacterium]
MKLLQYLAFTVVFASFGSGHVFAAQSSFSEECLVTVNSYMDALKIGELAQLKSLIAPPLLSKKKRLLENQSYSGRLYDKFHASSHNASIVSYNDSTNIALIDVVLSIDKQEPMLIRFKTKAEFDVQTQVVSCKIIDELD